MSYTAIAALLVLVVSVVVGVANGLFKTVWSVASIVLSIILAGMLNPIVQDVLTATPADEYVQENIENWIRTENLLAPDTQLTDPIDVIRGTNLPSSWQEELIEEMGEEPLITGIGDAIQQAAAYITDKIMKMASFILVFLIIGVVLRLVSAVFHFLDKLPVLRQLNHLAGGAFGLLRGVIILWALVLIVMLFSVQPWAQEILRQIHASEWLTWLYDNNLLLLLLR